MRNTFTLLLACLISLSLWAQQPGDTTIIETFSYSDPAPASVYRGTFQFPPATEKYQKILMEYSLKCDPSTRADRFACGEWDYLSYTYLWDSSGVYDSTFRSVQTLRYIDGGAPDSLYGTSVGMLYDGIRDDQETIRYGTVTSRADVSIGGRVDSMEAPFGQGHTTRRSQFLWTATELAAFGAGDITGMKFDALGSGSYRSLEIRMRHTTQDSLNPAQPIDSGFQRVFRRDTDPTTGTQDSLALRFPRPFTWDGTSNIVVEVSYEFDQGQQSNVKVYGTPASPTRAITSAMHNYGYLKFNRFRDMVNCGPAVNAAINGNQPRTVEAWARVDAWGNGGIFQAGLPGATNRDFSLRTTGTRERFRVQLWGSNDFDVTLPGSAEGWHHYAVSYDGAVVRLYYDGELAATNGAALSSGNGNFLIGRWNGARFNGGISDVRCARMEWYAF
jgi:hypothetical protein